MRLIVVVWRDAHSDQTQNGWCSPDDLVDDAPYLVASAGWLLLTGDGRPVKADHVSLAQSAGGLADESWLVDTVLHIPVENVRSQRDLLVLPGADMA